MLLSPRIRLKPLAHLCHRLATATNAGIQDRKIWSDEAERGTRTQRSAAAAIRDRLSVGESLADALRSTGDFFPPLFRQMVEVGEVSGRVGEIYKRLAQHFDQLLAARRAFWQKLAWPLMQLGLALAVIGLLIWVMGVLPVNNGNNGEQFDMLGFGLIGNRGLMVYLNILLLIALAVFLAVESMRRGLPWMRRLQRLSVQLPVIGQAFKTLALGKFTWAMQMVLDTPMDLRKALPLALQATGNDHYAQHARAVVHRIETGQSITQALAATGVFPSDLLDNIAVGEESGRLVETMQREAAEYEERSGSAMAILAQFAGYAIWLLVAAFIIVMIFRLFSSYVNTLNSLM